MGRPSKYNDSLIGKKYGNLTILGFSHIDKYGNAHITCKCICGKLIEPNFYILKRKNQISCGCINKRRTIHGYSGTKLYDIWKQMKYRCENPKNKRYKYYGSRGITVCNEWDDFLIFRFQMRKKYLIAKKKYKGKKITIERIGNNKGYYYHNCTFIPHELQAKNKRNVIPIKAVNRKTGKEVYAKTQRELAKKINTAQPIISHVINGKCRSRKWIIRPLLKNPQ